MTYQQGDIILNRTALKELCQQIQLNFDVK